MPENQEAAPGMEVQGPPLGRWVQVLACGLWLSLLSRTVRNPGSQQVILCEPMLAFTIAVGHRRYCCFLLSLSLCISLSLFLKCMLFLFQFLDFSLIY